jgi:hypothetical protein
VLGAAFQEQVDADKELKTDQRTLQRRVLIRWNSDLTCISSVVVLKDPIQHFTGQDSNKCAAYRLTDSQWKLLHQLEDLLMVRADDPFTSAMLTLLYLQLFEPLTLRFSQKGIPLIAEVLDDLDQLEDALVKVRDTVWWPAAGGIRDDVPEIIRVAAQAALLVLNKYHSLFDKCKIYPIAIGLSIKYF